MNKLTPPIIPLRFTTKLLELQQDAAARGLDVSPFPDPASDAPTTTYIPVAFPVLSIRAKCACLLFYIVLSSRDICVSTLFLFPLTLVSLPRALPPAHRSPLTAPPTAASSSFFSVSPRWFVALLRAGSKMQKKLQELVGAAGTFAASDVAAIDGMFATLKVRASPPQQRVVLLRAPRVSTASRPPPPRPALTTTCFCSSILPSRFRSSFFFLFPSSVRPSVHPAPIHRPPITGRGALPRHPLRADPFHCASKAHRGHVSFVLFPADILCESYSQFDLLPLLYFILI